MMCFCVSCTNQAECEELQKRVETLGSENRNLREELQKLSEECEKLASENNSIKVYSSVPFCLHKHWRGHLRIVGILQQHNLKFCYLKTICF